MELIYSGPWDLSGYGSAARDYVRALDPVFPDMKVQNNSNSSALSQVNDRGLSADEMERLSRLGSNSVSSNAIHIQHSVPGMWTSGFYKRSAGFTVYESDSLPKTRVWHMNLSVDEIWTASQFNKDTFTAAGITVPVHVIPHIVDVNRFHPDVEPLFIPGLDTKKFVFLSVFDFHWRKGWDSLLHAFWSEFTEADDVVLVLKIFSGDDSEKAQDRIQSILQRMKSAHYKDKKTAPVKMFGRFLSHNDMEKLYAAADCFVLASRGEGWGLGYSEAMAMELPTIGTKWSGNLEFMNDENSYLIQIDGLIPIRDANLIRIEPGYIGHKMAQPSIDHLRYLMRWVYTNRAEAEEKGKKARQSLADNFSAAKIVPLIQERLTALDQMEGEVRTGYFTKRAA